MSSAAGRLKLWLTAPLALAALAMLVGLGLWQVERLRWKETLLATISMRMAMPSEPLAKIKALHQTNPDDVEYRPTIVTGTFDHAHEQFFYATHKGAAGWYIYTPLNQPGDAGVIFINRGFVPYDKRDSEKRPDSQPMGEQTISGLLRNAPEKKRGTFLPDNRPQDGTYYWKDLAAMTEQAGLSQADVVPFFIDAHQAEDPFQLPIGGVTLVSLPNNHLQYAITWFGLAAALILVVAGYIIKSIRSDPRNTHV